MDEKTVKDLQQEIAGVLKGKGKPEEKLSALDAIEKKCMELIPEGDPSRERLMMVLCETTGNLYVTLKNPAEAEKRYRTMLQKGAALYQKDKKAYDLLFAQANLRMGVFYKGLIKIQTVDARPRKLNETQKKVYDISDKFFRNAVGVCLDKIKAGHLHGVELQGKCMENLMVLKGAVGEYEEAVKIGEQLIKLGKSIFQATDDAPHALELAQWMSILSTIYMFQKEYVKAMEMLEDCIYVLEDKESAAPMVFGLRLASSSINLGNARYLVPEEEENAEEAYQRGIQLYEKLNREHPGRFEKDLKQACIIVGNYYQKKGEAEKAAQYLARGKD
ncbi:MAG: tetratricopeptide repeat protein [Ruminococcus sp.]|jgi:tetratricopeptide (TPR) repeat protein